MDNKVLSAFKKISKAMSILSPFVVILLVLILVGAQNAEFRDSLREENFETIYRNSEEIRGNTSLLIAAHLKTIDEPYTVLNTRQSEMYRSVQAFEDRFTSFVLEESTRINRLVSDLALQILHQEDRINDRHLQFTEVVTSRVTNLYQVVNALRIYDALVLENLNDLKINMDSLYDSLSASENNVAMLDHQRFYLSRIRARSERAQDLIEALLRSLNIVNSTAQP